MRGGVIAFAAATALVAAGLGVWLQDRPETGAPAVAQTKVESAVVAANPATTTKAEFTTPLADAGLPEVSRWQGTDPDGDIHLDSAGQIVPDLALRQLFDYLLSSYGALDLAQIEDRLRGIAQSRRLDPAQIGELQKLFVGYVDYLKAATDLKADSTDRAGLQRVYDQRHQLRRNLLGAITADGYFAESEGEDRYAIDKVAIQQDKTLTPDERERRLAAARALAPPSVRESEASAAALSALNTGTEALRKQGGDPAQLQALRERTVGPEAAARLSALDREDAAWNQRLQAFDAARAQIDSSRGLSENDRRKQRDALIARDFTGPEAQRLRAQRGLDESSP